MLVVEGLDKNYRTFGENLGLLEAEVEGFGFHIHVMISCRGRLGQSGSRASVKWTDTGWLTLGWSIYRAPEDNLWVRAWADR